MKQKLGIIAGNRLLPLLLAQRIKENSQECEITSFCFKGQTSKAIGRYCDRCYWFPVGALAMLKAAIKYEKIAQCLMAGQINPRFIFRKKYWDRELAALVGEIKDFRSHTIFNKIISCLEGAGTQFLNSTLYLGNDLAEPGVMNRLNLDKKLAEDIDFGLNTITKFVELDVGQTIAVKTGAVAALESLEGTDQAIKRAFRLAGRGCIVLKFCKAHQDLRFDVPVVGVSTLKLLKNIGAAALVLEAKKVIILEKEKFLSLADKWRIPVVGMVKKGGE